MTLLWIVAGGLSMALIALVGATALLLTEHRLKQVLLPLVALAAGTLLGGAFFHLIPASIERSGNHVSVYAYILLGFAAFFALEQFLNWHHCHQPGCNHRPITYLILIADGLHNFMGGLAVGGAFLIDVRVGISAWIAAAAHELPQELGDFAILIHGGWTTRKALLYNFLSSLTFLAGGLIAFASSSLIDVSFLLPLAAGNFIYIAAADLIPEVKRHARPVGSGIHFAAFTAGVVFLLIVRLAFE